MLRKTIVCSLLLVCGSMPVWSADKDSAGDIRLTLHGGRAVVSGRRSPESLYDYKLATYDTGDVFDQSLAKGFVELWGLPSKTAARRDLAAKTGSVVAGA